jgi:hypothetical protein
VFDYPHFPKLNSENLRTLNLIYNIEVERGFRNNDPFQFLIRENLLKGGHELYRPREITDVVILWCTSSFISTKEASDFEPRPFTYGLDKI